MESAIFPSDRVTIFAVLNATPDSFSDGGRFVTHDGRVDAGRAVDLAHGLLREGAHVLDVGGESTRPGARAVAVDDEIARTVPLIEALAKRFDAPISIDTRKAAVAEAAIDAGASVVNDVSGLAFDAHLAGVIATARVHVVLGHMRGTPETMQRDPHYEDVIGEVACELEACVARARAAGIPAGAIAVDPGLGFGKRAADNLALLASADALHERLGVPVMLGPSRKSFLAAIAGDPLDARDDATAAACAIAVFGGARGVRVHAVAGAVRAVAVASAARAALRGLRP